MTRLACCILAVAGLALTACSPPPDRPDESSQKKSESVSTLRLAQMPPPDRPHLQSPSSPMMPPDRTILMPPPDQPDPGPPSGAPLAPMPDRPDPLPAPYTPPAGGPGLFSPGAPATVPTPR